MSSEQNPAEFRRISDFGPFFDPISSDSGPPSEGCDSSGIHNQEQIDTAQNLIRFKERMMLVMEIEGDQLPNDEDPNFNGRNEELDRCTT